jgi:GNAT superfamily N-acetyltransferase
MSNSSTTIEPATADDLPELTDLLCQLFTQESEFAPDRAKQMRGLRLIVDNPSRGRVFVLRSGNRLLGMINLLITISTAEGGFVLVLEDLVVDADFRGNGLGSQLLERAIQFAREKKFLRITLLTERVREADAQRFFRKHGFVDSNMLPMRLTFPENSWTA